MRTHVKLLLAGLIGLGASTAQSAIVVTLGPANGAATTDVAGAITETFDPDGACTGEIYSSCSGNFLVLPGSIPNQAAQPNGAAANFLSVPNPLSNGVATLTLYQAWNYFGLFWGSIDKYNKIEFYLGNLFVGGFDGEDIVGAVYSNGNQVSYNSNRFVNFFFNDGQSFDKIVMTSSQFAFETDNHAVAAVPLPAAAWLLLSGLVGLGIFGRRRAAA